ncbi:GspH/FimT family pseudopilin [Dechloromonas denitrificans]|uniref:GspH/FimT family pseudopilin n=1 Tax=Dechloromonas denitrificans TaxID=281362 RepID=UPI001CF822C3|nr:GspH/FimT family pseudopilin [Dechloromonas denitrificans]UCV02491.1 GspH/FimT family pseudopilin [Dechloromonas denitrificans]UCV06790.1 GspH/FimT family pseudopilin [Dechloromonas denitrificans]
MKTRLQTGITLIEVMISLVVMGILLALGTPSFSRWIQSSQIRNSAEAIQNGLTLARAEAVRRNTSVRFQLVSTVTDSCALSDAGRNWVISLDDPTGSCDNAPSDNVAPRIVQTRASGEGSPNAVINANGTSVITFNSMGQANTAATIDVTNPTGGNCSANAMRCLRVTVSTGGLIRMCDPARAASDPQGC